MKAIRREILLNTESDTAPFFRAAKGDEGREILLFLATGKKPVVPVEEEDTAEAVVRLPDSTVLTAECGIVNGGVLLTLTGDMTAQAGDIAIEINVADGGKRITFPPFYIGIADTITTGGNNE